MSNVLSVNEEKLAHVKFITFNKVDL